MIIKTESHYPYSRIESDTLIQMRLSESLLEILPHGSGIDYTWHISHAKHNPNRFYASNGYHAMDEYGGYCHSYRFTLVIDFISESARKVDCQYCNGKGFRYVKDMLQYHPTMTESDLSHWLESERNTPILYWDSEVLTDPYFICNVCNGKGYTMRYPFELIRVNFHRQREYSCCGYMLKDYIYETISECLSLVKVG